MELSSQPSLKKKGSIVLLSGGLDSVATLLWVKEKRRGDPVIVVWVNYGQKAAPREKKVAQFWAHEFNLEFVEISWPWLRTALKQHPLVANTPLPGVKSVKELENQKMNRHRARQVWVPHRNGLMVASAAALAEAFFQKAEIYMGLNGEEGQTFKDNSAPFIQAANQFLKWSCLKPVTVKAPFFRKSKVQIYKFLRSQTPHWSVIWSCYQGGKSHCGECESCVRLKRALLKANPSSSERAWYEFRMANETFFRS